MAGPSKALLKRSLVYTGFSEFLEFTSSCSVVEKDFGPISKLIFSLIEVASLMETTSPLYKLVIGWLFFDVFLGSEVSIVEFLFPALHFIDTIDVKIKVSGYWF